MRYVTLAICMIWHIQVFTQGNCGTNEIINAGFESGGTGWGVLVPAPPSIFNPPQPQLSTDAYSGQNAAVACGPEMVVAYTTPFQNESGRTYVVTACAKVEGNPTKVGFGAVYITLTGALTGYDTISVTSNSYECYTQTFVPPPNQLFGIGFAIEGGSENDKIIIDDFCVEIFDNCEVGSACDDNDPETVDDLINDHCVCRGTTCPSVHADAGQDQSILPNQSATLTAAGGSNYLWSTGETTQSIIVSPQITTTYTVCVANGNNCQDCDEVEVNIIETYDIGSSVWEDQNANGCKDAGEPGINNVAIELYDATFDVKLRTSTTSTVNGEAGTFLFENWTSGNYYLKVKEIPSSLCITEKNICTEDIDNDFDQTSKRTDNFMVSSNTNHMGLGLRYKPLAVAVSNLNVRQDENRNKISWTIYDEENINHFEIERKINEESRFNAIEKVNCNDQKEYHLHDSNISQSGIYYYRLAIYLESDEVIYSNISSTKINALERTELQINPNVTSSDYIHYTVNSTLAIANGEVNIFDVNGNRLHTEALGLNKTSTQRRLNVSSYTSGIYYMILNVNDEVLTKKFIKY